MTRSAKLLILSLSAVNLCACATTKSANEGMSADFGSAVAHNVAAQTVAPTPEQKANTYIPADRSRRELARKRYREDNVEQPKQLSTTN